VTVFFLAASILCPFLPFSMANAVTVHLLKLHLQTDRQTARVFSSFFSFLFFFFCSSLLHSQQHPSSLHNVRSSYCCCPRHARLGHACCRPPQGHRCPCLCRPCRISLRPPRLLQHPHGLEQGYAICNNALTMLSLLVSLLLLCSFLHTHTLFIMSHSFLQTHYSRQEPCHCH
jgi:hypothetical protein